MQCIDSKKVKQMEIERKYLVNKELWLKSNKPAGEYIIQGYLTADVDKTIRVRVSGSGGYITIKGKTVNISREEYEFPVPFNIATKVIQKFSEGIIQKIRYRISYKGKTWEVDEFLGNNEGLLIAEVELTEEHENVGLPEWIGCEVSGDTRYFNACLARKPFKTW
jgi:adenylate cyclase